MRVSVSNLEQFRQWQASEEESLEALFSRLWSADNVNTLRGKAFHCCMEKLHQGTVDMVQANGYTFLFDCDVTIAPPDGREMSLVSLYGPLTVSGRVDGGTAKNITEYKSTCSFDADRYQMSYQWRFYLDMSGADRFDWHIFEVSEIATEPNAYKVRAYHQMSQWRYPDLHEDCMHLAADFYRFAMSTPELLEMLAGKQQRSQLHAQLEASLKE